MELAYGRECLQLDAPFRGALPAPLADPAAAVRAALESPHDFPALRRALTPDDRVAIIVDERLPRLASLLTPLLEHLRDAQIQPSAVTLLCPPSDSKQNWVEDLPDAFEEVQIEIHDPADRKKLSYLATTKLGRRIYLNRTAVDADQLVVLARRGYDPLLGYSGAEGAIYPAFSDEETRKKTSGRFSLAAPGQTPWPARQEAIEVAWLLGAPFLVQVIAAGGDEIAHVLGGSLSSSAEGQRLLDERWRQAVDEPVHTVVAGISGDPARHDFADLAQALATAARVVREGGRIILLTQTTPRLGPGAEMLRQTDDPNKVLTLLREQTPADAPAVFQWASAAGKAHIYLLSGLDGETAEELFTTPLEHVNQVQRLLASEKSCLILPDAHQALAVLAGE